MTQETQETPTISLRGRTTIERRPDEVTITAEHLNEHALGREPAAWHRDLGPQG